MRDPKDDMLLARLQSGDESALEELVSLYARKSTNWPSGT